jgi:hypothetical protein
MLIDIKKETKQRVDKVRGHLLLKNKSATYDDAINELLDSYVEYKEVEI